jgi:hypothetical protein
MRTAQLSFDRGWKAAPTKYKLSKKRGAMKKALVVLCAAFLVADGGGRALADNAAILKEIQSLKECIEELEQKLEEQEALAKKQAAKTEKAIG